MTTDKTQEKANRELLRGGGYHRWVFADSSAVWAKKRPKGTVAEILEDNTWRDLRKKAKR